MYGGRLPVPCALPYRRVRQYRPDPKAGKSWLPPSVPERFPPAWSCRHSPSSKPSTRTMPIPSSEIWTLPSFLGGKEPTTLKELSAVLGKETIDTYNTGESRGRETSHSLKLSKIGERADEPGPNLPSWTAASASFSCAVCGLFLSDKYDITKHPQFQIYRRCKQEKTLLTLRRFLSARLKLKPNEICDVYEVDAKGV